MKVQRKCGHGFVEAEGENHAELWEQLAKLEEAFGETTCGKCNGEELRHVVRENSDGDKFYELHCLNSKCRSKLRMSVRKKGGAFFPKRRASEKDATGLESGTYLPHRGWMRYNKETGKEE